MDECNEWVRMLRKAVTSARRLSSQVPAKQRLQATPVIIIIIIYI